MGHNSQAEPQLVLFSVVHYGLVAVQKYLHAAEQIIW